MMTFETPIFEGEPLTFRMGVWLDYDASKVFGMQPYIDNQTGSVWNFRGECFLVKIII